MVVKKPKSIRSRRAPKSWPEFRRGAMTLHFPLGLASPAPNRNSRFPTDLAPHGPVPSSSSRTQLSPELPSRSRNVPFFLRPSFRLPFFLIYLNPLPNQNTHLIMVGPRKRKQDPDEEEEELQALPSDESEEEEE